MLLSCPSCGTVTQVADVLIPSARLTATCSGCGARIGGTVPSRLDSAPSGTKQKGGEGPAAGREKRAAAERRPAGAAGTGGRGEPPNENRGSAGGSGEGGRKGAGGPQASGGGEGADVGHRETGASEDGGREDKKAGRSDSGSKAQAPGAGEKGRGVFRPGLGVASRGLDPERLAKLVASDMMLYNREKIQGAAAEGRLLSTMAPEIVEAWEFYKKRVGVHTALGTSYFRDALNHVLAGGDSVI
jgi:hypothetical protein